MLGYVFITLVFWLWPCWQLSWLWRCICQQECLDPWYRPYRFDQLWFPSFQTRPLDWSRRSYHWAIWYAYTWMTAQPPVWMYSSATPLTSPFSLSLIDPGGRTCRAGGDLFWITNTELRSLVISLLKPEKSWTIVSEWGSGYCRGFLGWVLSAFSWRRRRRWVAGRCPSEQGWWAYSSSSDIFMISIK